MLQIRIMVLIADFIKFAIQSLCHFIIRIFTLSDMFYFYHCVFNWCKLYKKLRPLKLCLEETNQNYLIDIPKLNFTTKEFPW